ncbi:flagellar assembly protein FliH [Clostridium algoriphilum]|uniref:FliH/SctL family protein n=1 Tax=Clostridium algoriphilum TaxID=198347 RepID=UPI001CF53507|nr:flagellar assembly protein FliH [Clostridium algoriphilum]MCB2294299.1 flagellar assembly protein FliH [Clostridium algoriphilum]
MQLSFNVIKNSRVIEQGDKKIDTQLIEVPVVVSMDEHYGISNSNMESYETIACNILDGAKRKSEAIISKAYIDAEEAKAQAVKEGYEKGSKEGYETAYNEALSGARDDAKQMREQADSILVAAKVEYNDYLVEKEKHIKALIVSIAESILKKEVKQTDALNEMIFNTIKAERDIKFFIIKSNNTHFNMIKSQIEIWKSKFAFQGDIFVIEDNFLDDGIAVIEKETGKSIVSIDYGIEKIVEIFKEEQI